MKTGCSFFRRLIMDEPFAVSFFKETNFTLDHKKTIAGALKRGYKVTEEDMEKYTEGDAILLHALCDKG